MSDNIGCIPPSLPDKSPIKMKRKNPKNESSTESTRDFICSSSQFLFCHQIFHFFWSRSATFINNYFLKLKNLTVFTIKAILTLGQSSDDESLILCSVWQNLKLNNSLVWTCWVAVELWTLNISDPNYFLEISNPRSPFARSRLHSGPSQPVFFSNLVLNYFKRKTFYFLFWYEDCRKHCHCIWLKYNIVMRYLTCLSCSFRSDTESKPDKSEKFKGLIPNFSQFSSPMGSKKEVVPPLDVVRVKITFLSSSTSDKLTTVHVCRSIIRPFSSKLKK